MKVEVKKAVHRENETAMNHKQQSNYNSLPSASQGWFTNLLEQEIEAAIEKKQFGKAESLLNLLRAEK